MSKPLAVLETLSPHYHASPDAVEQYTLPYEIIGSIHSIIQPHISQSRPVLTITTEINDGDFEIFKVHREGEAPIAGAEEWKLGYKDYRNVELGLIEKRMGSLLLMPSIMGNGLYGQKDGSSSAAEYEYGVIRSNHDRHKPGLVITMPRTPHPELGKLWVVRSF